MSAFCRSEDEKISFLNEVKVKTWNCFFSCGTKCDNFQNYELLLINFRSRGGKNCSPFPPTVLPRLTTPCSPPTRKLILPVGDAIFVMHWRGKLKFISFLPKLSVSCLALIFPFDCVRQFNIQKKLRLAFSKLTRYFMRDIQNCTRKPPPWLRANEQLFFPNNFWWMRFLYAFICVKD